MIKLFILDRYDNYYMMYNFFRNTKPSGQLLALLLLLVAFFVLASGTTALIIVLHGDAALGIDGKRWLQILTQVLVFVCPTLLWAALFHDRVGEALFLRFDGRYWLLAVAGVLCYLLMYPLFDWLTYWNAGWHLPQALQPLEDMWRATSEESNRQVKEFVSQPGTGNLMFNLFMMALTPAVCEELFFRGALQQTLLRWCGNAHVAILTTAVIFSLAHGDMFGFVPRLAMGIALGYLFCYGGSVIVNIAAHFVNNVTVVAAYYLFFSKQISTDPSQPLGFPWWAALAGAAISVVFFAFFFKLNCKKPAQKES